MSLTREALQYYEQNPVAYVEDLIGVGLDQWQAEALRLLVKYHFLAIRSGSGVGKTALLSFALLWFLGTKPYSKVPATAPSQHQLYDLLWAECFNWISRSKYLQSLLDWRQTRIGVKGHEPNWYAVARTASVSPSGDIAEGLQGFHSEDNLLFIVDEGSGVADATYPAIEGSLTNENAYCIIASNPTRREGYFFDIFHNSKIGKRYAKMHISCYDSARVTEQYIEMMLERYGKDHPIFRIKVLGEFPSADEELLVPPAYTEAMVNNKKDTYISPNMAVEVGIDVGRTRSASVAVVRQGYNVLDWQEKHKRGEVTDTVEVTQWATEIINEYKPSAVKIDAIGFVGVYDLLKSIYGDIIVSVIGSASARDSDQYLNLRAEGYWDLRQLVPKLWCAEWPTRLLAELGSIRQRFSKTGKLHVETKQEMLKRALRSPDYADALMYAFLTSYDEGVRREFKFSPKLAEINAGLVSSSEREISHASRWRGAIN